MLNFFTHYPYIIYSIISWLFVFLFIKCKRLYIKDAIVGGVIIYLSSQLLHLLDLYDFHTTLLPIFGVPLLLSVWGAASGIVFAHYLGHSFLRRCLIILSFAAITVLAEYGVESVHVVHHVGKFNDIYEYCYDVLVLTTFAFISTHLHNTSK